MNEEGDEEADKSSIILTSETRNDDSVRLHFSSLFHGYFKIEDTKSFISKWFNDYIYFLTRDSSVLLNFCTSVESISLQVVVVLRSRVEKDL